MTVQTFRDLLKQQPFQPFRVIMSSGESYEVRHPEVALLTKTNLVIGIDETRDGVPSRVRMCSLLHITTVEPVDAAAFRATEGEGG